jgi:hypothetical protein
MHQPKVRNNPKQKVKNTLTIEIKIKNYFVAKDAKR